MPPKADGQMPYAPSRQVLQVIQRYRDRGLQVPFTKDVLAKAGVPDSLLPRVHQALRLLGMIDDDGNPTPALQQYARATADEARSQLDLMIRDAYEPIFAFVSPATDPVDRIRDAFRGYEPRGQQERMVALFLGLCQAAGIRPEPPTNSATSRPSPSRSRTPTGTRRFGKSAGTPMPRWVAESSAISTLPAAVLGVLRELATNGPTWTQDDRDRFMRVWEAVIDFSYPVREPAGPGNGDGGT